MEDFKIFYPLLPSLSHLVTVKVAVKLHNEFQIETWDKAYKSIKTEIPLTSEDIRIYPGCNGALKQLLRIPPGLRKVVIEAIRGLKSQEGHWREEHSDIPGLDDGECIFYYRGDGTIDTVKTVQQLLLDTNILIRNRFHLACLFCLEDSIKSLWSEMEAVGETQGLENSRSGIERFWVRWLRDGCPSDWMRTIQWMLATNNPPTRLHSFFPAFRLEERRLFMYQLFRATDDYIRLCLNAMTKAEENFVLRLMPYHVLDSCTRWPLRSLFCEAARKILKYNDSSVTAYNTYHHFLDSLLKTVNREGDYFYDFLECFWKCSPSHLRERINESGLGERIESTLNKMSEEK